MTNGPRCDCCGAYAWQYEFSASGHDLGRCTSCGLHYVAQLPDSAARMTELEEELLTGDLMVDASSHRAGERKRQAEFDTYAELVAKQAPDGPWLDIGCGTGSMLMAAKRRGFEIEGIELTPSRRALAEEITGCKIHGIPVEDLPIPSGTLAAVTMINVFSHLVTPSLTFRRVHEVLKPQGVLLLRTSEAGPGVLPHHQRNWLLGDHLYFLGKDTIEHYARRTGFELVERQTVWQPDFEWSREGLSHRGQSALKNAAKSLIVHVPGVLTGLRKVILHRHRENPIFTSTLVLKKK